MEVRKIDKLRLYLETTVFNYYFDKNRPGHYDVVRLFVAVEAGLFYAYTSEYVIQELRKAPEPKRSDMLALVKKYNLTVLDSTPAAVHLGELYLARGIIPFSHRLDSLHIAMASAYELDCIVSYNFQHINRDKTRIRTMSVNNEEGYGGISISTAKEVLNDE